MEAEIIKVDGRQYRKQPLNMALYTSNRSDASFRKLNSGKSREEMDETANDDEVDCTIQKGEDGQYIIKLDIDPEFYRFIIGKAGETKKRLQQETGTTIHIPQKFELHSGITISAPFEKAVLNARARIQDIVDKSADKLQFTHFISLPLYDKNIQERVRAFAQQLPDMDQSILVDSQKLHFTVCMLKLYGNDAIERAKLHLSSLQRQIYDLVGTRSTVVKLRGLKIMNDDPKNAHVVYTEPTPDTMQKVQELADFLCGSFLKAGIASKVEPHVKIHCTLINTSYRKNKEENGSRIPIDASKLLVDYATFDFGEGRIPCVDLSQRGKFDENGFYHQASTLRLP